MEKRFRAALLQAVLLHAAGLVGLFVLGESLRSGQNPQATGPHEWVDLWLLPDPLPSRAGASEPAAGGVRKALGAHRAEVAVGGALPRMRSRGIALAHDGRDEAPPPLVETGAGGAKSPSPALPARVPLDLGIDRPLAYSIEMPHDQGAQRASSGPAIDSWSESSVQALARHHAPREGSALLTIEWDALGHLQSIVSSAPSSHPERWRRLARALRKQLEQRPRGAHPGRALRLVYLVEAKLVAPASRRSKLPRSKHVSLERYDDEILGPVQALSVGVRADTSEPGRRVVSVTLASSHEL